MVKSMTGYGKGEYENELYKFTIEIKSLNHRYNDISINMPKHITFLEDKIIKIIKKDIHRGKVFTYISLEYVDDAQIDVEIDKPLAKKYKEALEDLSKELDLGEDMSLDQIINIPDIIKTKRRDVDEDLILNSLTQALNIALDNIVKMRVIEGSELKKDILIKLSNIENYLRSIEERSPEVIIEYKNRLEEKISILLDDSIPLDEDRLNNEVAYFIDKSGIDEEIVRLGSHIKQFRSILEENTPIGRKLDFLIQELNREINTIGSKTNDKIISQYVVDLKFELEKIREQVQNIE